MSFNASKLTHGLAAAAAAVWAFMMSPAGEAVQKQYPQLAPIVALVTTVLALYHTPTKTS